MARIDFSVVVPVFNSENTLNELFVRLDDVFNQLNKSFQVIFVDDNSQDKSWESILKLKSDHPEKIKAIRLNKNFGQQAATLCGIHNADAPLCITIDDDLQIPPKEIIKLYDNYLEWGPDIVYGKYTERKHSLIRKWGSAFLQRFMKSFSSSSGVASSFRLLNINIAKSLRPSQPRYFSLDEILSSQTNRIGVVNVEHNPRGDGKSGYSIAKLVFMTLNYIINYTVVPLRIMTYMGMISSLIFMVIGGKYIYEKLFNEVELGFTSIIVSIFFTASLILFSLGIIGEYISRLYYKQGYSAPYVIRDKEE